MTEIEYRLVNPTGNITALVETQVLLEKQPKVASLLMQKEPTCEQVGFVSDGDDTCDIRLRMAGGEFCGNATMSAAALFCKKIDLKDGEERKVLVKILGTSKPVSVIVTREKGLYFGTVEMPPALSVKYEMFSFENRRYRYPVVSFAGISHVIIEDNMSVYMAERAIKLWCDQLKAAGLGFMLLDSTKTQLRPLVYIPNADTLVWESSCASGTSAVGAFFCKERGAAVQMSLKEPGGTLTISADESGKLLLSGMVEFYG